MKRPRERLAHPYRDLEVIDSRAPRFNQAVVGVLSAAALATGWWWLLALLAAQLAVGLTLGRRFCLPCLAYFELVQPLFGEGPLEDARPPRFANMVGAAFLSLAAIAYVVGAGTAGAALGGLVAGLALVASVTGFCAGCEAYKLGHLLTGRRFVACPLPPRSGSAPRASLDVWPESGSGRLAGVTHREAASSVAPICLHMGAPCVLASRHVPPAIHRERFPAGHLEP